MHKFHFLLLFLLGLWEAAKVLFYLSYWSLQRRGLLGLALSVTQSLSTKINLTNFGWRGQQLDKM